MSESTRTRGQAFTLEGVIGSIIVLSALVFVLQAVIVSPSSSGSGQARADLQQQADDALVVAANAEDRDLSWLVRYWSQSERTFYDAQNPNVGYGSKTPPGPLGEILQKSFANRSHQYNLYMSYLTDMRRVTQRADGELTSPVGSADWTPIYADDTAADPEGSADRQRRITDFTINVSLSASTPNPADPFLVTVSSEGGDTLELQIERLTGPDRLAVTPTVNGDTEPTVVCNPGSSDRVTLDLEAGTLPTCSKQFAGITELFGGGNYSIEFENGDAITGTYDLSIADPSKVYYDPDGPGADPERTYESDGRRCGSGVALDEPCTEGDEYATEQTPIVFRGTPSESSVVATYRITLYDNQTLTSPNSADRLGLVDYDTRPFIDPVDGKGGYYPVPDAFEHSPMYNVVEVRLVIW